MMNNGTTTEEITELAGRSRLLRKKSDADLSTFLFGRVPPQARDFEELVLGAIMVEREGIYKVAETLFPEMFYVDAHQKIYQAILNLFNRSEPIDIFTVPEELRKSGELEIVGGSYYVQELTIKVVSSANIEYHSKIIVQKFKQREIIRISSQMVKEAFEDTTDVFDMISQGAAEFLKLQDITGSKNTEPASRVFEAIKQIEAARNSKEIVGIPSGFKTLDHLTGGFQKQDLIVVAARPGHGKSALVIQFARGAAMNGYPVQCFSLEMSNSQIALRELAIETGIKYSKLRSGRITDDEFTTVVSGGDNICNLPFYVDSEPKLNVPTLRAKLTRALHEKGIKLCIIDYLNLMETEGWKNKYEKVTEIVKELKRTAKHLDIPIILVAQLNREVEKESSKRPHLHHLRDSGAIEEYADIVALLYRPALYNKNATDENGVSEANTLYIDLAKHKQGATGDIKLYCEIEKNIIRDFDNPTPF